MIFMLIFLENDMMNLKSMMLGAMLMCCTLVMAQGRPQFNPAQFKADLEKFITAEAGLSSHEAASFFPVYHEMNEKQRVLYNKMRNIKQLRPQDEKQCKKAISDMDRCELEIKQIQMNYHNRFLKIISAEKLYNVIRAEEKFHRQAMRQAARR